MVKLVFKKNKAQLLASFASVSDLWTRFENAGLEITIRNHEHGVDYMLTEEGFAAAGHSNGKVPEPKIGEIDVKVIRASDYNSLAVIHVASDLPAKLASLFFVETSCMFGPGDDRSRIRVYKIKKDVNQGLICAPVKYTGLPMKCSWTGDLVKAATVCRVQESNILFPPSCNKAGEQLAFADGCADAPTEVPRFELLRGFRMLEIAVRHVESWPTDTAARTAYARNCARLFAGIGVDSDTAVQIARQCEIWAGNPEAENEAILDQLDDLVVLGEAELKSLCSDLWGAGGLKLGETYYNWFKVDEPVADEDIDLKLPNGFALASDIHAENVEWVWPGYIPKGAITMIDGLPDQGKSTLTCDIAARITAGTPFPDGPKVKPRMVVMINGEDFAPQVMVPRIRAAGGDPAKTFIWPDPEADFASLHLPDKLSTLEQLLDDNDVGLVIIDPLHSHLSSKHKVENDQNMKAALQPLTKLAQAKGISILAVRHTTKVKTGLALIAGLGSIGTIGTARAGYIVGQDPDGTGDRVFACSKMNVAPMPKSLRFRIIPATVKSSDGKDIATSRIEWLGESTHTADNLCKPDKGADGSALDEAVEFLQEVLADGPMPASEVYAEAKQAGISGTTVTRAKAALGIKPKKTTSHWEWALPEPKE